MAPAPTKTPSQAASNAATARSQRRSVRATSWRRGPPPPVGTGARIAEGAGLGPGALTLAPGGRYRPLVVRFSMSEITTLGWSFERDVEAFAAAGAPGIGLSLRKLEAYGVPRAACRLHEAGLAASCLVSSGGFPLGDAAGERRALGSSAGCTRTSRPAPRASPSCRGGDFKVGTMSAS